MLELYNTPHSTCSQKVRICLAEKNLEWTDRHVNLATKEHLAPAYLKINPNGVVPTLIHDGAVITDSSVICEYIDEVFPAPALTPAEPAQKAVMRAWLRFGEEVPTVAVRVPSFNMAFLPRFEGLSEDEFHDQQADIRPLRKQFYRRMGRGGFDGEDFSAALEQIHSTAQRMNDALAAGPWLLGEQYTLADIILAPLLDRMADLGFADLWNTDFPRVTEWFERSQERAGFKRAFLKGTRLSELHDLAGPTC
ncbi:MAG: glutathione S-transferase family protein [Rhodospirillaceae bacterium]|jgi:glutathione S-transferase|nr:glutathione S-transferase family protein [Rhodospirillaceae bacterium]MBT7955489.1 glutathione S-transferase family protein [Rhodospirillaceae bacterium]